MIKELWQAKGPSVEPSCLYQLVVLKDREAGFGRETAGQGGALVADGMAVTLFIGGDAGISGYGAGVGQDDLQNKGERSGRYERSEGA